MKKYLSKENFILFYILIITSLYPVFLLPDKMCTSLSRYYQVILHYSSVFFFFAVLPMIILKFGFKEKIKEYGWNFNNFSKGIKYIIIALPILTVMLWFSAKDPSFIKEYPLDKTINKSLKLFLIMEMFYLLYYIGWEFLFRGFIVLGLSKLKNYSIILPVFISTLASTLMHYTKPGGEIILALAAGIILGLIVYKYKTIWFVIIIHFFTGIIMDLFIIIRN